MTGTLDDPIFHDEEAARAHFEAIQWPNGPVCPHCGNVNITPHKTEDGSKSHIAKMKGKSHRKGLYWCFACGENGVGGSTFTVTVGTVMESSHIKLHKWALAFHLMASSKKGVSAHQLHRMLGITYKSAWFMAHRIREAMADRTPEPIGGGGKTIEIDETYYGQDPNAPKPEYIYDNAMGWIRKKRPGPSEKRRIITLIERGGRARSVKTETLTGKELTAIVTAHASLQSNLMTDEAMAYNRLGKKFLSHLKVNHSKKEYARREDGAGINSAEGFFSLFKRGMRGIYQHCGDRHMHRYLSEFDFRYSNRIALGIDDKTRAEKAIKNAIGKRLTYKAIEK